MFLHFPLLPTIPSFVSLPSRLTPFLPQILGPESGHDVGFVVSQSYNKKTGHRKRSYSTVKPLADAWGLKVEHSCHKYDPECAARKIREYVENGGTKEIVLGWVRPLDSSLFLPLEFFLLSPDAVPFRSQKGMMIGDIAAALGVNPAPHYPGARFVLPFPPLPSPHKLTVSRSPASTPSGQSKTASSSRKRRKTVPASPTPPPSLPVAVLEGPAAEALLDVPSPVMALPQKEEITAVRRG